MKGIRTVAFFLLVVLTGAGMLIAGQPEATKDRGKMLFNDPKLGTTGKSCNDCHPNGKGAEKAAAKNESDIARIVNACITNSIKGKALETNSNEMRSLVLYIKSLGNITKPAAPKKAPIGC